MKTLTESQNVSLKRPIARKPLSSTSAGIGQRTAPEMHDGSNKEDAAPQKKSIASALQLYSGGGKIRSEQPAARGNNLDITI